MQASCVSFSIQVRTVRLHPVHGCNSCTTGSVTRLCTHLANPMCLFGHCLSLGVPVLCSIPAAENVVQLLPPKHHLNHSIRCPHLLSKRFLSRQPEPPCRCALQGWSHVCHKKHVEPSLALASRDAAQLWIDCPQPAVMAVNRNLQLALHSKADQSGRSGSCPLSCPLSYSTMQLRSHLTGRCRSDTH